MDRCPYKIYGRGSGGGIGYFCRFTAGEDISDVIKRPSLNMKGDTSIHILPSGPSEETSIIYNSLLTLKPVQRRIF